MTTRVKIFTTTGNPEKTQLIGVNMTKRIDDWIDSEVSGIEILSVKTIITKELYSVTIIYSDPSIKSFDPTKKDIAPKTKTKSV